MKTKQKTKTRKYMNCDDLSPPRVPTCFMSPNDAPGNLSQISIKATQGTLGTDVWKWGHRGRLRHWVLHALWAMVMVVNTNSLKLSIVEAQW